MAKGIKAVKTEEEKKRNKNPHKPLIAKEDKVEDERQLLFSDPVYNEDTKFWECKLFDEKGNEVDLLQERTEGRLITEKEKRSKEFVLERINKQASVRLLSSEQVKDNGIETRRGKSTNDQEEMLNEIIELKLKGAEWVSIVKTISEKYNIKPISAGMAINQALQKIREKSVKEIEEVLEMHFSRYEYLYKWFNEHDQHGLAARVLGKKEKLVGVGTDVYEIQVNNYFDNDKKKIGPEVLDRSLNIQQKKRLLELVGKLKINDNTK